MFRKLFKKKKYGEDYIHFGFPGLFFAGKELVSLTFAEPDERGFSRPVRVEVRDDGEVVPIGEKPETPGLKWSKETLLRLSGVVYND